MSHTHGQTKTQSLKNIKLKDEGTAFALKIATALHGTDDHIKWQSCLRHVLKLTLFFQYEVLYFICLFCSFLAFFLNKRTCCFTSYDFTFQG